MITDQMTEKTIEIAKDFSRFPGGRVRSDGPYSGEVFREDFLLPALNSHDKVTVKIDGVIGYGSSFLEECFGGLVRRGQSVDQLKQKLHLVYDDPVYEMYEGEIWEYIEAAS